MTENLNTISTTEIPSGSKTSAREGVDEDLIKRINSIRVQPQSAPQAAEKPRSSELAGIFPGQRIGDWIYSGADIVSGRRANNVIYADPTEVVRVSRPVGNSGMSHTREIPASEFESWLSIQGHNQSRGIGSLVAKTEINIPSHQ